MTVSMVTGAGSGIGAATAATLAARGDVVICADIDLAAARRTASPLERAEALELDVRDERGCGAVVAGAVQRHGRLDVAVACAGIQETAPAHQLDPEAFQRVLDVNLTGAFLTCRAVFRTGSTHAQRPLLGPVPHMAPCGPLRRHPLPGRLARWRFQSRKTPSSAARACGPRSSSRSVPARRIVARSCSR